MPNISKKTNIQLEFAMLSKDYQKTVWLKSMLLHTKLKTLNPSKRKFTNKNELSLSDLVSIHLYCIFYFDFNNTYRFTYVMKVI